MRDVRLSNTQITQFCYDIYDTLIAEIKAQKAKEQPQTQEELSCEETKGAIHNGY